MADITDPEAIKFANEQLRPLCEAARALKARVDSAKNRWYGGLNLAIPNEAGDALIDGRAGDGVSVLTGAQIHGAMAQLIDAADGLNAEIIERPAVRPLDVRTPDA